jgi:hypothetical protein
VKSIYSLVILSFAIMASACQTTMLSDDRIASNTAGVLGVSTSDVKITDRRADGPTNTYYTATTKKGSYGCVINGGGLLAGGMTNPPVCNKK